MKIRIATYNIHKGVSSIGSRPRVHALKQALSSMEAEILFLQEVQGRHDVLAAKHATHWPEVTVVSTMRQISDGPPDPRDA